MLQPRRLQQGMRNTTLNHSRRRRTGIYLALQPSIDLEKNMAKRVMDRRALRAQSEAAEHRETDGEGKDTDKAKGDDEGDGKKKKKTTKVKEKSTTVKKKTKRSSKASVRMRSSGRSLTTPARLSPSTNIPAKLRQMPMLNG
ncbi:MAG: hypothetical protein QM703_06555 [Gemmatales bacterium]